MQLLWTGYLLDDNGEYVGSWGSLGPEFNFNGYFFRNNSIYGFSQNGQNGQNITILNKAVPRIKNIDIDNSYGNILIQTIKSKN